MCNLAVVHAPFDLSAQCVVVESSDGNLWSAGEWPMPARLNDT